MLPAAIRAKLSNERYLHGHLAAAAALRSVKSAPWYDSAFLRYFEAAKIFLRDVRPELVENFVRGFDPIRPPANFDLCELDNLFDRETRSKIKRVLAETPKAQLEHHEESSFGRQILRDHPFFTQLQGELQARVSELAGRPLSSSYNFMCLYGDTGQCELHMDEPRSMYTLDYCIDTDVEWPIYLSNPVNWPSAEQMENWTSDDVMDDPQLGFAPHVLKPNSALFFTGSSQWHYRSPIPDGGFAHLLFFHFYPTGFEELVLASNWHRHFDIPELEPLCDLLGQGYRDVYKDREQYSAALS